MIYGPALIDIATASFLDVRSVLDNICTLHVSGVQNSFKAVFVVGDQRTYDRMCVLTIEQPEKYSWCFPLTGDFHFQAHAAAFHDLFFLPFSSWLVEKMKFQKV